MKEKRIENALSFYLLATKLKELVRSGWKLCNVKRDRLESVAEHVYGTCILAIAIDSEFDFELDLGKVIMMLVLHELEEIIIGDYTPVDKISAEDLREKGAVAVARVLKSLSKKQQYLDLLNEFEEQQTFESKFVRMCDKLECDIQAKLYTEEGAAESFIESAKRFKEIPLNSNSTMADVFIENSRKYFTDKDMEDILDFVKKNEIIKLREKN